MANASSAPTFRQAARAAAAGAVLLLANAGAAEAAEGDPDVHAGHRADPAAEVRGLPPRRPDGADAAGDLRGSAAPGRGRFRSKVVAREMPPWHIDKTVGIQEFVNDISLSDEQIAAIARWVDIGGPRGDPGDMPPPREWPQGERWRMGDLLGRPARLHRAVHAVDAAGRGHRPVVAADRRFGSARGALDQGGRGAADPGRPAHRAPRQRPLAGRVRGRQAGPALRRRYGPAHAGQHAGALRHPLPLGRRGDHRPSHGRAVVLSARPRAEVRGAARAHGREHGRPGHPPRIPSPSTRASRRSRSRRRSSATSRTCTSAARPCRWRRCIPTAAWRC